MSNKYILSIDQSTQGTKALLFDKDGRVLGRSDYSHDQLINSFGWVEHNPVQIYNNTLSAVKSVIEKTGIMKSDILCVGVTNQRETAVAWDRETGNPVYNAIVWQCARGAGICEALNSKREFIQSRTGLPLSPYYSAAKIAWILQNVEDAKEKSEAGTLCYGNMDSWLIYNLTKTRNFKTDYSNASRTQLFNVNTLSWDEEICSLFGINTKCLAEVCDSDALYGETDFAGYLDTPIPIHSVMGDSHSALFSQFCHHKGMAKATYGTGSSIMMNIGAKPLFSKKGVATSLAWKRNGKAEYVLEGNINYTGAVIAWLKNDLKLIQDTSEAETLATLANAADQTCLVPAFSGLGAPYMKNDVSAIFYGMTRTTGKAELVKAALDSIAYQITDVLKVILEESSIELRELKVDGGPTRNAYLMQFQSDIANLAVRVSDTEELSAAGAAYMAGSSYGFYDLADIEEKSHGEYYLPKMNEAERSLKYQGWKKAVDMLLNSTT
jgi:glycerol kinase